MNYRAIIKNGLKNHTSFVRLMYVAFDRHINLPVEEMFSMLRENNKTPKSSQTHRDFLLMCCLV